MAKKSYRKSLEMKRILVILIVIFFIMSIITITLLRTVLAQEPVKFTLPTDQPKSMPAFGNSATPNETEIANNQIQALKTIYPSSTPLLIEKEVDLSPNLKDYDKYLVIVARADGINEEIKVGPANHNLLETQLPNHIIAKLNIGLGDKIILWYDIAIHEAHNNNPTVIFTPFLATPTPVLTNTIIPIPYP